MSDGISNPVMAEKGVLASILFYPDDLNIVADLLTADDFSEPQHQLIYGAMMDFYQRGQPIDPVLLAGSLDQQGHLESAGGISYFFELADRTSLWATGNTEEYALMIRENARLRRIQTLSRDFYDKTQRGSGYDSDSVMGYAFNELQQLASQARGEDQIAVDKLASDTIDEVIEKSKLDPALAFTGIPTGFVEVDSMTGGFRPGQMIIVAGRPAMGKSTIAMNMATAASLFADKAVMFYSLEMTKKELILKILSSVANVEHNVLKTGQGLTEDHLNSLEMAKRELEGKNLMIRDTPKVSLLQMRSQCIMQKAKPEGLDMLVVDYIGLMDTESSSNTNRQEEISKLSRGLKLLAKELEVPIIVLAQLNREGAKGTPDVSHLRDSGALEQDADMIFLVHRPEVFDPNDRPGVAELILGKHRGGPTGTINLVQLLEYSKFGNLANTHINYEEPADEGYGDSDPGDREYPDAPPPREVVDVPAAAGEPAPAW